MRPSPSINSRSVSGVGNAQEIEKRLCRHSGRNYFLDISVRANLVEEWEQ